MEAAKRRGRKPGSLVRTTCCICSTVELGASANKFHRCGACKAAGLVRPLRGRDGSTGKDAAIAAVQIEIREGRLPHPTKLACTDCRRPAEQYEHRDYNKPLAVQPICRSCNLLRGPAIPLAGSLERIVAEGVTPYALRHRATQLFAVLGIEAKALASMPKRLTVDHWRVLLGELAQAKAA